MADTNASPRRLTAGGPHYYPLRAGSDIGGEVYERMLLEHLPGHGIDLVLGLPRDHRVTEPPRGWRIDVLRHRRGLHWVGAPLAFTPYVVRLLRSRQVDLLRAESVRYCGPALLAGRALARSRVPIVIHQHHLYPRWAQLEAAIMRRADAVITVSAFSQRRLVMAGVPAERIHVVPEGVARPAPTGGWTDAWPQPGLRLLHVGRLEPRKRPWVAIDALAVLQRSGVAASLVVAGEGPLREELRGRAGVLGVSEAVWFAGRVPEPDKWRLYDSADVLLFASALEGFGLVVAEAQSRGVPVVAAIGTATAEALDPGRSGLLTTPDGEAFAAQVRALSDGPRRLEMGARAVRHAERFDWDACAAGVARVYRELVDRRR
ncbi:MAG: glycosyltransferase family 4 protein [Solirubrobacterales bacterium]|nr:glycosyltransferase family 4 protein [Solirubrobacterales bacterium]